MSPKYFTIGHAPQREVRKNPTIPTPAPVVVWKNLQNKQGKLPLRCTIFFVGSFEVYTARMSAVQSFEDWLSQQNGLAFHCMKPMTSHKRENDKLECSAALCCALLHPQARRSFGEKIQLAGRKKWVIFFEYSKWHKTSRNAKSKNVKEKFWRFICCEFVFLKMKVANWDV